MRKLTCKHKIWLKNWLYLRPHLKAFSVFNVLETCREYFLTIDLGIVEFIKKFIERFFNLLVLRCGEEFETREVMYLRAVSNGAYVLPLRKRKDQFRMNYNFSHGPIFHIVHS